MGENHLTYFKIENFKRFDSFEMENLGQYNLLVGDNNVGKTSVLEGLLFKENTKDWLVNLFFSLTNRKIIPNKNNTYTYLAKSLSKIITWESLLKNVKNPFIITYKYFGNTNDENISLQLLESDDLNTKDRNYLIKESLNNNSELWFRIFKGTKYEGTFTFSIDNLSPSLQQYNFLSNTIGHTDQLVKVYLKYINNDKGLRKLFDEILRLFIPNLEETRLHSVFDSDCIGISLTDENNIYPIARFGDGSIKIARTIIGVISSISVGRLMIDEIETGIHFSRLKDFWKTVITLCKKYDVQLFATTHSLECQKYFVYALAELEEEDRKNARNISLLENKEGNVESVTFDYEQFEFALEIGANTRGGER